MTGAALIVKVCGITRREDGLAALEAGADWLGLIRWPRSARYRPLAETAALVETLRREAPHRFELVGVYVDADRSTIEQEYEALGLDRVQLHGQEPPDWARALPFPVIKALRFRQAAEALAEAQRYAPLDLLADAYVPDQPGGTGQPYDYAQLGPLVARHRVLVAGGLDPESVGAVVRLLRPWGVDVSSGVETAPGLKDPGRIRAFLANARAATDPDGH